MNKNVSVEKLYRAIVTMLTLAVLAAAPAASAQSSHYKVIHSFTGLDGVNPVGNLISDASGNLYGMAEFGGNSSGKGICGDLGCGTVYKLTKTVSGGWARTVLHNFTGGLTDGAFPVAGLVLDGSGNLYGTTRYGGSNHGMPGAGVAFELSPKSSGGWKETLLHVFGGLGDGQLPSSPLALDPGGNLYGTAVIGGAGICDGGCGVVFELSPGAAGGWNESLLYTFGGAGDGSFPVSGLTLDSSGNLYGTALGGGNNASLCAGLQDNGCGVVFRLSPNSSGGWTESVVDAFNGTDGANPQANLVFDGSGNLYGTAHNGGDYSSGCDDDGCGLVYELSPSAVGWNETVLRSFVPGPGGGGNLDGALPEAGLTLDAAGNLYGTNADGGRPPSTAGVVFKLSPNSTGPWTETVLYAFSDGADGGIPYAGVILDASGDVFGTTYYAGVTTGICATAGGCGVVFDITP
jgi:hypothetical protein